MKLLSVPQAAKLLNCSPATVRKMIAQNQIPVYRVGKRLRVNEEGLLGKLAVVEVPKLTQ